MISFSRAALAALGVAVAACGGGGPAAVQRDAGPSRLLATRSELQELARQIEEAAPRPESDSAAMLTQIRERLANGDFHLNDRILLFVDGEAALTDSFTVDAGQAITLPGVGAISLRGLLRAELEDRMREEIGRIVRQPVVRARSLVRVGVIGAVRGPGFHYVAADGQMADVITAAGGYTPVAKQADIRVERDGRAVISAEVIVRAFQRGETLDRAGVLGGDQFVVPERGATTTYERVRLIAILLSIPITIFTLTQIFQY
jgi:polysaccharide export outer membrane protein